MADIDTGDSIQWLFAQKPRGRLYGIDRMRALAEALGHPERAVPCIHMAGTNGKGSVAAMLESIFRHEGYRVGLYTSPHLVYVGERVQVDRQPLNDGQVAAYLHELRPVAEQLAAQDPDLTPSFFEYMTAMAMLEFVRRECDLAIFEVGLGGRLDATNIVAPRVSVITSIGLDHCELLGDTIEKIAAEKAGIIKPGVPLVVGRVPSGARTAIAQIAGDRGAPATWVEDEFGAGHASLPVTNLAGDYQRWNAATATLAAQAFQLEPRAMPGTTTGMARDSSERLAAALQDVRWPGRWECREVGGRTLILDTSHNPEGAETLDANLSALVAATGANPIVVVGVLGAARARPLLEAIARHAAAIHLVRLSDARACSLAELRSLIPAEFKGPVVDDSLGHLFPSSGKLWEGLYAPIDLVEADGRGASPVAESGQKAPPTIVITGSIYLIGEVMKHLG